jgi:hypothetical protein
LFIRHLTWKGTASSRAAGSAAFEQAPVRRNYHAS